MPERAVCTTFKEACNESIPSSDGKKPDNELALTCSMFGIGIAPISVGKVPLRSLPPMPPTPKAPSREYHGSFSVQFLLQTHGRLLQIKPAAFAEKVIDESQSHRSMWCQLVHRHSSQGTGTRYAFKKNSNETTLATAFSLARLPQAMHTLAFAVARRLKAATVCVKVCVVLRFGQRRPHRPLSRHGPHRASRG